MLSTISVGVIGATGKTGQSVVNGLLNSPRQMSVVSLTRNVSLHNEANKQLSALGVVIVGYDPEASVQCLAEKLEGLDVLISCMTWEQLASQIPWIKAAKMAGVKRFVPSEWVSPAPRGVIDIKDKKLDILGVIQREGLPYTLIDVGCWFQVFVPKVPSGKSDHARMIYIDDRIVDDGHQKFAMTDMSDIGLNVAKIISDPRTLNKHVFAYTEVMSMNEIWETMADVTGEAPDKRYVSCAEIRSIVNDSRNRLQGGSSDIMDIANFNMGQYRESWCIRGDNTPAYAEYLGCLDFWQLYPDFKRGRSLENFFQHIIQGGSPGHWK